MSAVANYKASDLSNTGQQRGNEENDSFEDCEPGSVTCEYHGD